MGERRDAYKIWWRNLRERDHLEDPSVDGKCRYTNNGIPITN
jgi:hypothetical protein